MAVRPLRTGTSTTSTGHETDAERPRSGLPAPPLTLEFGDACRLHCTSTLRYCRCHNFTCRSRWILQDSVFANFHRSVIPGPTADCPGNQSRAATRPAYPAKRSERSDRDSRGPDTESPVSSGCIGRDAGIRPGRLPSPGVPHYLGQRSSSSPPRDGDPERRQGGPAPPRRP